MAKPETKQRKNPAPDLLDRINAYCDKHGLTHNMFTVRVCYKGNLVKSIQSGMQFHPKTLARVEAFLAGAPETVTPVVKQPVIRAYGRDPCRRCGVRGDIGCDHQGAGEGRSIYA